MSYFKCLTQQESPRSSILFLVRKKKKKKKKNAKRTCFVVYRGCNKYEERL